MTWQTSFAVAVSVIAISIASVLLKTAWPMLALIVIVLVIMDD